MTIDFLNRAETLIPAEVRMISGCDDEQTSADVSNVNGTFRLPDPKGRAGGACTSALLDILYEAHAQNQPLQQQQQQQQQPQQPQYPHQLNHHSFIDILLQLRQKLSNDGFSQIPQFTSSRPLDIDNVPFHLVGGDGTQRAVLVGINYKGQDGELSGCQNDVFHMRDYITKMHGFHEENIAILIDDPQYHYPTKKNMMSALEHLVQVSESGDSVFVHYSGHGGLLPDDYGLLMDDGDYKETVIPLDHQRVGHIRDMQLFRHFVQPMRAGVTVTCVMDCCHSGSVLDLPYSFKADDESVMRGGSMNGMVENAATLMNLAALFSIAGGILPDGFGDFTLDDGTNVAEAGGEAAYSIVNDEGAAEAARVAGEAAEEETLSMAAEALSLGDVDVDVDVDENQTGDVQDVVAEPEADEEQEQQEQDAPRMLDYGGDVYDDTGAGYDDDDDDNDEEGGMDCGFLLGLLNLLS